MAATPDQIDQQRRVVMQTRASAAQLLAAIDDLTAQRATYDRLGLGDNQILGDEAFGGTGTSRADYRAAIVTIDAIQALLAAGHGTNLEKFAR
jgi:UDP-N-acetylenolpyruvoylglucosamine reductase